MSDDRKKKTGPPPQAVKIDVPWEQAVAHALTKTRPAKNWPGAPKPTPPKPKKKKPA
jgi:hypothetical protein